MNGYYNNDFDLLFELAKHRRIDVSEALMIASFALNVTMNDAVFSELANFVMGHVLTRFNAERSTRAFLLHALKNAMAYIQRIEEREQAVSKQEATKKRRGPFGTSSP